MVEYLIINTDWLNENKWYIWTMIPLLSIVFSSIFVMFGGEPLHATMGICFNPLCWGVIFVIAIAPLLWVLMIIAIILLYAMFRVLANWRSKLKDFT